jgi:hypothetical protein
MSWFGLILSKQFSFIFTFFSDFFFQQVIAWRESIDEREGGRGKSIVTAKGKMKERE